MEPLNYEQKAMLNAMTDRATHINTKGWLIVILGVLILVIAAFEGITPIISAIMGALIILLHRAEAAEVKQLHFLSTILGYKTIPEADKMPKLPTEA